MGWEPRTVYEYDDAGRLVGSRPEAEWDDTERAWMLSLADYRRNVLCPCGCGFPAELSQDPMTEFKVVVTPYRCHIRTALVKAQKQAHAEGVEHSEGRLYSVSFRD